MKESLLLEELIDANKALWSAMRRDLWEECDDECNDADYAQYQRDLKEGRALTLLGFFGDEAVGFIEAQLRRDYVPGATKQPIWYVEGIYVKKKLRRAGVGDGLVRGLAERVGATELASDTEPDNRTSRRFHEAIGFKEVERSVHFWLDLSEE